jgi:uncharacterized membrane protein (UPF0127 family)
MRSPPSLARSWALLLCLLTACTEPPQSNLPTVAMAMGSNTFTLEIAADPAARDFGLMRRDSMPARHGMIFVFADEQPRDFWMRNTRFDLDIIYLDARGRIVSIKRMKAYDESSTPSDGPAKYAIELNAGGADALRAGQTLPIPQSVMSLTPR